jgi:integrase
MALKSLKAQQAPEKLAAGPEAYEDSGRVLVDELGAPQRTDWLRRRFKKLVTVAGLRPCRPYDARHATLTWMAMNGVPDVIVSAWPVTPTFPWPRGCTCTPPPRTWSKGGTPWRSCSDDL